MVNGAEYWGGRWPGERDERVNQEKSINDITS